MDPDERKDLSRAEWKVMRVVWELRKAMAREIYTIAGRDHSWAPATVKTILKRLVDKGYVTTTAVGNGFVYRPAEGPLAALTAAADDLVANAVAGATGPLVAHLVERVELTASDLDALAKLIEAKQRALQASDEGPHQP